MSKIVVWKRQLEIWLFWAVSMSNFGVWSIFAQDKDSHIWLASIFNGSSATLASQFTRLHPKGSNGSTFMVSRRRGGGRTKSGTKGGTTSPPSRLEDGSHGWIGKKNFVDADYIRLEQIRAEYPLIASETYAKLYHILPGVPYYPVGCAKQEESLQINDCEDMTEEEFRQLWFWENSHIFLACKTEVKTALDAVDYAMYIATERSHGEQFV